MVRRLYYYISIISLLLVISISFFWTPVLYFLIIIVPFILIGIHDIFTTHNVLRLYPVIGHLRYMLEFVRPEIQQYFIATNLSGRPFNRQQRDLVYQRAQAERDTQPFGTQYDVESEIGYDLLYHSMAPVEASTECERIMVGGPQCKKPYNASRLNISAMSFGALGKNAVLALNKGAKLGGFAHNTGEGGLSDHHLAGGGDIIWQIGTAYFGCRTKDGNFDSKQFKEKANLDVVKMIEIKISQGAKPSHGGVLPAAKITKEISRIRGVPMGQDCISPPGHKTYSTPEELCHWIAELRELTGGKPIGFKLCVGIRKEFMGICKAMLKTGIYPDFITVDGAEGGTGAAPVEYSNRFGTPLHEALVFVDSCLLGTNLRDKIRIIASGKRITGYHIIAAMALGADMCNMARPMMFALGCIQSLRCHANTCPTGVTTQDPRRQVAIDVERKHIRVANYHHASMHAFMDMLGAMGLDRPDKLLPTHIYRRVSDETVKTYEEIYHYLQSGELLTDNIHPVYAKDWALARSEHF